MGGEGSPRCYRNCPCIRAPRPPSGYGSSHEPALNGPGGDVIGFTVGIGEAKLAAGD